MLAMERLPLSQPPFSGHLSLSPPTMHSPRAGVPAPLIQGLPSPPALHSSLHGPISAHAVTPKVRPSSSSSLSSVHTPPPYGDTTMIGSAGPTVYSPTHASSLLPQSSTEHHDQLACHGIGATDPRIPMPPLSNIIGHPSESTAEETSCNSAGSSMASSSSRDHHSSSPAGEPICIPAVCN